MGLSVVFVQSWKLCLYKLRTVLVRSLCYWKVLESIGNVGTVVDGARSPAGVSQHKHLLGALVHGGCVPAQTFA